MKNLAFKVVGNVLISVYNERVPTDADDAAILAQLKKMDLTNAVALIHTTGGAPTAPQRKRVYEVLGGRSIRAAIVSDSIFVRGISTAMSWFNASMKVFTSEELDGALEFLGIPATRLDYFQKEMDKLRAELTR